jgi:transposase
VLKKRGDLEAHPSQSPRQARPERKSEETRGLGDVAMVSGSRAKWAAWEACGLYFFFLPKYCSELNPIEPEWHQVKTHELRGHMFEHELDLVYAVIDGIDARTIPV